VYDAIVVGARCAGAPTALHLARRGRRVLLLDRATFPSETISTHLMTQTAVAHLRDWGLLDAVVATGAPAITRLTSDWGDFTIAGRPPPVEGVPGGFAPRRSVLDKLLLDAALAAGAELRERSAVDGLLWEDGRAVGVRVRSAGGRAYPELARVVVGADGRGSTVARLVGAEKYDDTPPLACQWYAYWSGLPTDGLEGFRRGRVQIFAIPCDAGLTCLITVMPRERFDEFRADVTGNYARLIGLAPSMADRVRSARREGRIFGSGDLPNFFRRSHGPGWALVGDAGYHKDPLTAQGIRDAFRDAERLAGAIDDGLSGRRPLDDALADYASGRDAIVREIYDHTCKVAVLPEPTEQDYRFRDALRRSQPDVDRFFGVADGTIPPSEFFAPENIARIMGGAAGPVLAT
jgi:flavin-dependent dehydrogenase